MSLLATYDGSQRLGLGAIEVFPPYLLSFLPAILPVQFFLIGSRCSPLDGSAAR